ncbi:hypothetical protein HanPSC8_Chr03g0111471 [Helianthus annuus]|nr:hypothetical protein HanPSC8_Chr03g0111471 [Helianthus annuus]
MEDIRFVSSNPLISTGNRTTKSASHPLMSATVKSSGFTGIRCYVFERSKHSN